MPEVSEVAENIYLIDAEAAFIPKLTAAYLINEEAKVLIETGPATAKDTLVKGLRKVGVNPRDISYIIATHIHIDHAGGIGALIREMPEAKVLVHPRGSKHLVEPDKLINSTRQILGEAAMERYGSVLPVEPEKIQPVEDNQVIPLGPRQKLKVIHTPGHAPHHLCIYENRNKGLFTGEVAGFLSQELEIVLPNTAPPTFDLELNLQSLEKVMSLFPEILYFSHFGTTRKAADCLRLACNKLEMWGAKIYETVQTYPDDAIEKLHNFIHTETESIRRIAPAFYDRVFHGYMLLSVKGYIEYFKTKQVSNL